mmetsp:Transcript_2876/g.5238  ORF Transcript_2876/g.5238 Transcript_2876/m.5238 type:complete len:248 (-) Transcript_2876:876-1619(-)
MPPLSSFVDIASCQDHQRNPNTMQSRQYTIVSETPKPNASCPPIHASPSIYPYASSPYSSTTSPSPRNTYYDTTSTNPHTTPPPRSRSPTHPTFCVQWKSTRCSASISRGSECTPTTPPTYPRQSASSGAIRHPGSGRTSGRRDRPLPRGATPERRPAVHTRVGSIRRSPRRSIRMPVPSRAFPSSCLPMRRPCPWSCPVGRIPRRLRRCPRRIRRRRQSVPAPLRIRQCYRRVVWRCPGLSRVHPL